MAQFAQQNKLIDLGTILDSQSYRANYDQSWVALGTSNNKLVGVFIKAAVKGLIWYNPKVWQSKNFQVPKTWDDLSKLAQQMSSGGTTPWCIGLESGCCERLARD